MKRRRPPWRRPLWLAWFAAAGLLSFWLALNMPAAPRSPARPAVRSVASQTPETVAAPANAPARSETPATGNPFRSGSDAAGERAPLSSRRESPRAGQGTTPAEATHEEFIRAELTRALKRLRSFAGLFCMVGAGAVLGSVAESRRWHLVLGRPMQGLARAARLPDVVGLAMPAALLSNAAANGMLVSSHASGEISRSALIAGGMANSWLAHTSHSIRVMYPVIAAVGVPGALYFGGQLTGGFLFVLGVLAWNRHSVGSVPAGSDLSAGTSLSTNMCGSAPTPADPAPLCLAPPALPGVSPLPPLPWTEAFRRALTRAASLLFRMACITVPLALGVEWLLKNGAFDFWERLAPAWAARLFPAELMSIVAAQMGGLVQSASLAAHLRAEGLVDNPRILLAMLVASAVGNPFRMLRRNLPSALGLFPPAAALAVALGMQAARLCVTLALIALVIFCLPAHQAG